MNEKEKRAMIYFDETLTNKCDIEFWKRIKNLIKKQQKEIEEKTTILLAGAEKVKQLEKEIEREKQYTDFYKDLCNKQQKEIEELKENELLEITENFISKDKIRELKEKVEKEMISNPYDFSYMINKLLEEN